MAGREFDIVIYGATGFVGKLTAEYLARAGGGARIALAGRSPEVSPPWNWATMYSTIAQRMP